MTDQTQEQAAPAKFPETYVEMFDEYLSEQDWITSAERPLVFHARKLCQQLDSAIAADDQTLAAKDGAYLQAVNNLAKRKPGAAKPAGGGADPIPGQTSILDPDFA